MHGARVAEADFGLRRVHIDVDQRRVDADKQADGGLAAAVQHVAVGFAQGVGDHLVAHEAVVYENILAVLGFGGAGRVDGEAADRERAGRDFQRPCGADEIVAEDVGDAPRAVAGGELEQVAAVVGQAEGDIRAGHCQAADGVGAVGEFGAFGLEEFAPGRGVVIEIAHFDDGAGHQRRRFRLGTGFGFQLPGVAAALFAAGEGQPGNRGDRGQGFAAETEGADVFEIFQRRYF